MRCRGLATFLVALAGALLIMCVTGPMMAMADNPCETAMAASAPCANKSLEHQPTTAVDRFAATDITVVAVGLPALVSERLALDPSAPLGPSRALSYPLRA